MNIDTRENLGSAADVNNVSVEDHHMVKELGAGIDVLQLVLSSRVMRSPAVSDDNSVLLGRQQLQGR